MSDEAASEDKHANTQISSVHGLFLNVEGDLQIDFHYIGFFVLVSKLVRQIVSL